MATGYKKRVGVGKKTDQLNESFALWLTFYYGPLQCAHDWSSRTQPLIRCNGLYRPDIDAIMCFPSIAL